MKEQEERVQKKPGVASSLVKAGASKAFNKLPTKYKLIIIGIVPAIFLFLLIIIVAVDAFIGPILAVLDFMKGIFNPGNEFTSKVEEDAANAFRDKYRLASALYGSEFRGPLFLATLFYNPQGECTQDDPDCGTGDYGISYINKESYLVELVGGSYVITKETYACNNVNDNDVSESLISKENLPTGSTLFGLERYSCDKPNSQGNAVGYSVKFDETAYDTYVIANIINYPERYGLGTLSMGMTIASETAQSILQEIKNNEAEYEGSSTELIEESNMEECALVVQAGLTCTCNPSAKAVFVSDPQKPFGGQYKIPKNDCSGLSASKFNENPPKYLEPEFWRRINLFVEYVRNDLNLKIYIKPGIWGGWRSLERQIDCTTEKCADAGNSKHGWGVAIDMDLDHYKGQAIPMVKIHKAAPMFGLKFNLCPDYAAYLNTHSDDDCWKGEYWHLQPQNLVKVEE